MDIFQEFINFLLAPISHNTSSQLAAYVINNHEIHHLIFCKNNQPHCDKFFKIASMHITDFENLCPETQFRKLLVNL